MAQKQSDQIIVNLVERLKSQGYGVRPNASLRGKAGGDYTFDYLVVRRDGFMNLMAAVEVINDAEDPETSLHKLFAFQDKCAECDVSRCVVIAFPRLSFVASQFAQKDGVEVFDEQAVQMFLNRPPPSRPAPQNVLSGFSQKSEVHQALRTLGYRVDETVRVVGDSGADQVFSAMAMWDDGFMLSRLGIDYLSAESVDKAQVAMFDDKCRDVGIPERLLLIPKDLTDDARKFAEQKRIEIVSLDGRRKEVLPDAAVSLPSAPIKAGADQGVSARGNTEKSPESTVALVESASPLAGVDKAGEKKDIVVTEVKSSNTPTPNLEGDPAPDKATAPAATEWGTGPVILPFELPSPARAFSMRSVVDQFLRPQIIRPKPVEKDVVGVGSGVAVAVGNPAVSSVLESNPGETLDKPAAAQSKVEVVEKDPGPPAKADDVAAPSEGPAGAENKVEEAKDGGISPPADEPVPSLANPEALPQLKAIEAKAVLVAERPNAEESEPVAKVVEAKAATAVAEKAGQAKVVPVAKAGVSPERPSEDETEKPGVVGKPRTGAMAGAQPVKPGADKSGQAKLVVPVLKSDGSSGQRGGKQGVIGKAANGASAGVQPGKPGVGKAGGEKAPAPVQGKPPVKPPEPPKPVVEPVVEKPKVKLRKAAKPEALQLVPEATARRFSVLPIGVTDNVLEVAMANPGDLSTIQVLELQSKMRIRAVPADLKEIQEAIDFNYKGFGQIAEQISHIETGADAAAGVDLVASTANAPVAAALNLIVEEAVKSRASDIHIEPEEKRLRIRYRIDGVLHEVMSLPIKIHPPLTSRVKVMSDLNIADHLRPQDGQFSLEVKGKPIDVRVATSPTVHGETVVMRILDKSMAMMELPQLGFTDECLTKYMKMLAVPFGMICVSGPTGAGKTTTLYASLNTMDKVTRNIITAEDPVEYRFEGIKQIQVNQKAGLTFASVLRSMMRLDPDVILVGEVRDAETASIAVKAALTGHTVLCSVHANDSVSVIYRLLDLGVEAFMVASVIVGTIAQRMARRVCSNCAVETEPTPAEAAAYESAMGEKLESYMSGSGCDLCSFSGYKGRLGLYEVFAMSDTLRTMVLKGATTTELRNQAIKEGMVTLFKDGMQKVKAGKTTIAEVLRNASSID